ncbi:MAG: bifunctional methylenetetrahydrofolate dehydrogenase/methenyltetrahydrofolate cyclohydrolase FolD [Oligoflexus sp.]
MSARIIDGKAIANQIREQLRQQILSYQHSGHRPPCLAVILVGHDPASEVYVGHKKKACASIGIESRSFELPEDTTQDGLESLLRRLNEDETVDGILVQLPLPKHMNAERAIDMISPGKDVDGLTPFNQGMLVWRRPGLRSCTPYGVMKLLEAIDMPLEGKVAAVVGRSVLVGAPMATMLSNAGATVYSLHSKSENCPALTSQADILVVATGVYHLVDRSWVKPGAVVIDVGMHRLEHGLAGDVNFDDVKEIASYITPVPGGVGPTTIAMLLSNCVQAYATRQGLSFPFDKNA